MLVRAYKVPITWQNIEEQDTSFEKRQASLYKDEISHFKRMSELYISLFSNSKRINRATGKPDYIQLIAIRIFQDSRGAFILAMKGLYPQAESLLRGVLESINLIYDFIASPTHEDLWFNASISKREKLFKASEVRKRVESSKITNLEPSKGLYSLLSNFSIHTNMESHLWYMETRDKKLFYHWAGHGEGRCSEALMFSVLSALAQGLFVLTYEGAYALDRRWGDDFDKWKGEYLIFVKKFGKIFGDESVEKLVLKKDIKIYGY